MTQTPHREVDPAAAPPPGAPVAGPGGTPASPQPSPSPRRRRPRVRHLVAIGVVGVVAGLLFGTSAALFGRPEDRQAQNLAELVEGEGARVEQLTGEVEALRTEVAGLVDEGSTPVPGADPARADVAEAAAAGRVAVTGPGVTVSLWDAPTANAPADARPDDLLVHQQDVEGVVNALWAGGAEAMTIQGQRVTFETAVRCVGNVLLLSGVTYSPPYEIAAIGDPDELLRSLYTAPDVQIYLQYVDALGLGWSAVVEESLEMPAAEGPTSFRYATVPPDALAAAGLAPGPIPGAPE